MSSLIKPAGDVLRFLAGDATGKSIKGPLGRDPKKLPVYGMDEKTVLGELTVYVSEEMHVLDERGSVRRLQVFWKNGRCLGVTDFGQPGPKGMPKPDALTMHPEDREILIRSSADQRQRYAHDRPALPHEKYPGRRKGPQTLH